MRTLVLLATTVLHEGIPLLNTTPNLVRLTHGARATILIKYSDVPVGSESRCPTATRLGIRPPGQTGWLVIRATLDACGHGAVRESPVLAGVRHAP